MGDQAAVGGRSLPDLSRVISEIQGRAALLDEQITETERRQQEASRRVLAADAGLAALHAVRDVTSARVQQTISELGTEALQLVFEAEEVRLEIRAVERRGVIEADLVLVRGDLEIDPLEASGGGLVADLAAILRLVLVRLMGQRGLAPLLVLDEPFAALSADRRDRMAEVMHTVAEDLGVQVLMVSHQPEFDVGLVYEVRQAEPGRAEVVLQSGSPA